jgi:predicted O-methyltransferase YrrM
MTWSAEFAVACVSPATGAVLRLLASTARARSVVEVGTGLGVSGLWLLQGLPADAVLTTIDIDADHHAMARQAFSAAEAHMDAGAPGDGAGPARTRLITGPAAQLLDRLADGAYDLMFVDIDEHHTCTEAAQRILRPDGLLVLHHPTADDLTRLAGHPWRAAPLGPDLLAANRRA